MATKLTGLGEITSNFLLNDFTMYIQNTSATGGYVSTDWEILGYTGAEKSINPISEKYVREDKIPRVATYTKTIRKGLEITTDLSNLNLDVMNIMLQGTISTTGTGTRIGVGTTEATQEYRAIRLVGTRDDLKNYSITIPKCELTQNGEMILGGEEETKIPLMLKAFYNPSADATANLYYEDLWNNGVSVTADVPPSYT